MASTTNRDASDLYVYQVAPSIDGRQTLAPSIEWYATLVKQSIVNALLSKCTGSPTVQ